MKDTHKVKTISIFTALVLLILALGGTTFAWFTRNRVTETDRVTSGTGEDSVELYVSSDGGANFKELKEADILQINDADKERLMPVSTADLKTFFFSGGSQGKVVSSFVEDSEEKYFYHGRIYLKAVIKGQNAGKTMNLYLDETNGSPLWSESEELINASRLGLTFDGGNPVIISLSDKSNVGDEEYKTTTVVGGVEIAEGSVLGVGAGGITAVPDPARPAADFSISINEGEAKIPAASLMELQSNKIYTVDIYYYMEGCDPDCNGVVALKDINLQLAFYGVLNSGVANE